MRHRSWQNCIYAVPYPYRCMEETVELRDWSVLGNRTISTIRFTSRLPKYYPSRLLRGRGTKFRSSSWEGNAGRDAKKAISNVRLAQLEQNES